MVVLTVAVKREAVRANTLISSRHFGSGFVVKDGIWCDSKPIQDNLATHRGLGESCGAR